MCFCNDFMATFYVLCRSIASTTAVLKARWVLAKVVVGFLSFGLVLSIVVVFFS